MNIESTLHTIIDEDKLLSAAISNPISESAHGQRVSIRPLIAKNDRMYQVTSYKGNQAFHRNLTSRECEAFLCEIVKQFRQTQIFTADADYHILHTPAGITCKKRAPTHQLKMVSHNRQKQHLLPEGTPDSYLIGLGLMSTEGKIIASKAHKFRQINRFLELVDHSLKAVGEGTSLHIVDLGCGKAYLTFALYHYLREVKGLPVRLTGVDLKTEVLEECQQLAHRLGYTDLQFVRSSIEDYNSDEPVDVVVALHACNTATDHALAKAVGWNARFIFAAPCCQQELYSQISAEPLDTLLQHGILKERFAALVTDAARADLLESVGYQTQIVEFVDLEHSPKNLLLRAEKKLSPARQQAARERYQALAQTLHLKPTLEKLLK